MKNVLVIIVILTWCSLGYAQYMEYIAPPYYFDTLQVNGTCKRVFIEELAVDELKKAVNLYHYNNKNISLNETNNNLLVNLSGGYNTIYIPKDKAIKKSIIMDEGETWIRGGAGSITVKINKGYCWLEPTIWGDTDITLTKGDVILSQLSYKSNVLLDLYIKERYMLHPCVGGYGYFKLIEHAAWLWWWAHAEGKLEDDTQSSKKLVKIWAKDGHIHLFINTEVS